MTDFNENFSEADADDIAANPAKYGAPTFEQFKANREKYLGRRDDTFNNIDKGSQRLKKLYRKQTYEIEGRFCKSLEEVETVARNELGIDIADLDYSPEIIPQGGGNCELHIKFISKAERARRQAY